jgi:hypothetical protein
VANRLAYNNIFRLTVQWTFLLYRCSIEYGHLKRFSKKVESCNKITSECIQNDSQRRLCPGFEQASSTQTLLSSPFSFFDHSPLPTFYSSPPPVQRGSGVSKWYATIDAFWRSFMTQKCTSTQDAHET